MDIGHIIDGEEQQQQGKAKEFFTDPKNLATMLVLGAALAAPRRPGYSPLAHTLRSGVGALGFRGGIEKGLDRQEAERAEAQSVQAHRTAEEAAAAERNRVGLLGVQAQNAATAGQALQATANRDLQAELELQRMKMDADLKKYQIASAGYQDAVNNWILGGQVGPPPNPELWFGTLGKDWQGRFSPPPGAAKPGEEVVPTPNEVRKQKATSTKVSDEPTEAELSPLTGTTQARQQLGGLSPKERSALLAARKEEGVFLFKNGTEEQIREFLSDNSTLIPTTLRKRLETRLQQMAVGGA